MLARARGRSGHPTVPCGGPGAPAGFKLLWLRLGSGLWLDSGRISVEFRLGFGLDFDLIWLRLDFGLILLGFFLWIWLGFCTFLCFY